MGAQDVRTSEVPPRGPYLTSRVTTHETSVAQRPWKEGLVAGYHLEALPARTANLLGDFAGSRWLAPWYLAGGTALALHYGHRSSDDLDFFTQRKDFDVPEMERRVQRIGRWRTTATDVGTLYGKLKGVKVSFIAYPWFHPRQIRRVGFLRLLGPDDIAVMKALAIAQRGRRRDFVDLYAYCQRGHALHSVLERAGKQYPDRVPDAAHFLRSLVYFADAENDPMPALRFPAPWNEIKRFFEREVPKIARDLLGLR